MINNSKFSEHLPERFGFKEGAEEFPLMIMVTMSNVCNSRCIHCPFSMDSSLRKREDAKWMSSDLFRKIINECAHYKAFIRVTGTGEPFMQPDLPDLLIEAKEKGVKCGCITNGSLLTPDKSKRLIDRGVDVIEISVDAMDELTYSEIRHGLNFATLLKNIDYMVSYKKKINSPTCILASIVENPDKIDVKAVEEFWRGIGVDNVIIRKYLTYGTLDKNVYSKETYLPPEKRVPCPYPFERMVILAGGEVTFCNFDVKDGYFMGNINEQSIKEVWNGEAFKEWRNIILTGKYEEMPLCSKCEDWKYKSWKHNFFKVMKNAGGQLNVNRE